tara:strand:- start:1515 stop:1706 length:192 start_codon:yes stop_codon:yes gene_type:complete
VRKAYEMRNRVTDEECKEALEYFWSLDMLNNRMNSDEKYYCKILLKRVANTLDITLIDGEDDG